jgi:TolB-like protein/DNA-binding winged helix-turn-helix (wHTH) protein
MNLSKSAQSKETYSWADFRLEPATLCLTLKGTSVALTHKPFLVLVYLIEHRERVVTRRELLETFWQGHDVYEESLTKCVGAIRKALNDTTDNPRFIVTHWAEGYRFIGKIEEAVPDSEDLVSARVEKPIHPSERSSPEKRRSVFAALSLAVIACAALGVWYALRNSARTRVSSPPTVQSIAVLPLKNETGTAENDYVSDGITESLIASLSQIEGLKVIARGSVFNFKEKAMDPVEVGRQLNVAAVMMGSIRSNGDTVRISTRLVSAADGSVIWASETADRSLKDVFELQDEVTRNTLASLRVKLSSSGERYLAKRYTNSAEAYQLYLKGRYHWEKYIPRDVEKSIEYYQQAINLDPNFALAFAGLSDAYFALSGVGAAAPNDVMPKAKAAALRAIEIDETLAEAHTSLGVVKDFYDWDFANAEREFRRAIELNPNSPTAHHLYAKFLPDLKDNFDDSISEFQKALEIDPFSVAVNKDFGETLYYARRYDQAIEQFNKTLLLEPNYPLSHSWLARVYEAKGDHDSSFQEILNHRISSGASPKEIELRKETYAKSGWKGYWQKQIELFNQRDETRYIEPYFIAWIYLRVGDKDQALVWLDKAFESRSGWIPTIKFDPLLDDLRSEPRFQDLVRRVRPQ